LKTIALFLFLFLSNNIAASDIHWEAAILEKMLTSMTEKNEIKVYAHDKSLYQVCKEMRNISKVNNCNKADFILAEKELQTSCKKPKIVFNYNEFKNNPYAVGVFFWQKGRPTIRFSSKRLKNFGLQVEGELAKFVSSKN